MENSVPLFFTIIALSFFTVALGFGAPVKDFCVADSTAPATAYGRACKDPASVTADDFFFSGLNKPSNTSNIYGGAIIPVSVSQVPGLNNLGIALARADLLPNGLFPPHVHPTSTEVVMVLEGSLQVGFVTSNPTYKHFTKTLEKGDVFVVPVGLVHYAYNAGKVNTVAVVAWSNEDISNLILLPQTLFGAKPDLNADYLSKSFQLEKTVVEQLLNKF